LTLIRTHAILKATVPESNHASSELTGVALRCWVRAIKKAISRGDLSGVRIGHRIYLRSTELDKWAAVNGSVGSEQLARLALQFAADTGGTRR
jgi:hypothetical protein